jgi:hypothetical protein
LAHAKTIRVKKHSITFAQTGTGVTTKQTPTQYITLYCTTVLFLIRTEASLSATLCSACVMRNVLGVSLISNCGRIVLSLNNIVEIANTMGLCVSDDDWSNLKEGFDVNE